MIFNIKYKALIIKLVYRVLLTFVWGILIPHPIYSQNYNTILNRDFQNRFESLILQSDIHSSIKPFKQNEFRNIRGVDSLYHSLSYKGEKNWLKAARNYTLLQFNSYDKFFSLQPILNTETGFDFSNSHSIYDASVGGRILFDFADKFTFNINALFGKTSMINYLDSLSQLENVISGLGYAHPSNNGYIFKNLSGYVSYSPSKYFNFQLGKDRNFIGDGYRSLLLSDNANNYPFFKITSSLWKFKYINLYTNYKDIQNSNGESSNFVNKFSTTHYLSYNVTKRLSIGLFETVIFQQRDSTNKFDYDVTYLNPVIFYRPVEYSIGSADNSLMGLNLKWRPFNKFILYGQAAIDEFLLSAIKEDVKKLLKPNYSSQNTGWWANKYAFQLGMKWFDVLGLKNTEVQYEYNFVRPFTYSHGSALQNYGHYNQALAHPLGANFNEVIGFIRYYHKNWTFEIQGNYAIQGADKDSINYGSNIFQSYNIRNGEFGHYTGQGLNNKLLYGKIKASYLINPQSNLRFEIGMINRYLLNENANQRTDFIYLGIRTGLWNFYNDR